MVWGTCRDGLGLGSSVVGRYVQSVRYVAWDRHTWRPWILAHVQLRLGKDGEDQELEMPPF
jgi:hypothetical protein